MGGVAGTSFDPDLCAIGPRDQREELSMCPTQPLVCGVSLRTFVVGQPFRFTQLRKALVALRKHPHFDRVWVTTRGRIAEYVAELPHG